jgi:hypothetical protein
MGRFSQLCEPVMLQYVALYAHASHVLLAPESRRRPEERRRRANPSGPRRAGPSLPSSFNLCITRALATRPDR